MSISASDLEIAQMGMDMLSDEEHSRRWHPSQEPATSPIWRETPSDLIKYNTDKQVSQLQMKPVSRPSLIDKSTMVVHMAVVRQEKEQSASYGVYFGPGSKYNASGILDKPMSQTQSRAEIEALSKTLAITYSICDKDFSLMRIYIATSSKSLHETITDRIYDWIENEGELANGKEVENFSVLKQLHQLLEDKEYGDDGGIEVKFWYRPIEENEESHALALKALE